jgi:hypothetical protein
MQNLRAYWRVIFVDWGSLMSGPFSVGFAFLGAFDFFGQRWLFVGLAFCSLLVLVWRQALQLLFLQTARLRVACSPQISCCRTLFGDRAHCAYRVRVRNIGRELITNCKVRLTSISRDNEILWNSDSPQLTFTPSEGADTLSKSLEYDVNHTIDILFLYRDKPDVVAIGTPELAWGYKRLGEIFSRGGDYRLHVRISGSPMVDLCLVLLFKWNCNYATSELWLEKVEPEGARDICL